jgi:hypothetical protein
MKKQEFADRNGEIYMFKNDDSRPKKKKWPLLKPLPASVPELKRRDCARGLKLFKMNNEDNGGKAPEFKHRLLRILKKSWKEFGERRFE